MNLALALALALSLLFSLVHSHAAHDEHDEHEHTKRLVPSVPLQPPSAPLVWGDFNVIHTTDTHGWLLGHQKTSFPEPNYRSVFCLSRPPLSLAQSQSQSQSQSPSGDFGDFASFVAHMKQLALEKNVDLLLVDSGDVHDGTGLSDGFPPGQVDAHAVSPLGDLLFMMFYTMC